MDNYYSSPKLFNDLVKSRFCACSTVRSDRRGIKQTFKDKVLSIGKPCVSLSIDIHLNTGEVYSEMTESGILCLKWKDKRDVCMLSTFHDDSIIDKNRRRKGVAGMETIRKPKVVEEYNQSMNDVDRPDQMVLYYGYSHRYIKSLVIITAKITPFYKAMKWWKRNILPLAGFVSGI
uniref:PiggyBac transposable element-derived protein domain-containing protein n=2 Tax=Amphimedon queenslandica TaxID=400682 RepID=A0A1X7T5H4_AMPQE